MAKILALDASSEGCSVALSCEGVTSEYFVSAPRQHAQQLLPMVDRMLSEHQLTLNQIDAIAFGAGPGSFTGLRIACGIVQGLAFGAEKPVIPVSTLAALAYGTLKNYTRTDSQVIAMCCLDARLEEVYWGCYVLDADSGVKAVMEDQVCSRAAVNFMAPVSEKDSDKKGDAKFYGIGNGWAYHSEFSQLSELAVELDVAAIPRAVDIAFLSLSKFNNGDYVDAENALPNYLRGAGSWKKRQPIRAQSVKHDGASD